MKKLLLAATCIALAATCSTVQPAKSQSGGGTLQRKEAQNTAHKPLKQPKTSAARRSASPSGNPGYDVYVRGEYVGSDPDPRIRATIRQEATRNYGFH